MQQELPELNSNYPTLNQEEIDLHADLDTFSLSLDAETYSSVPAQSESAEVHSLIVGSNYGHSLDDRLSRMTDDQKEAYHHVVSKCVNPVNMHVLVFGPGSLGKSFLISLLVARLQMESSVIGANAAKLAAPIGLAASNIKGITLHLLFRLPVTLRDTQIMHI